MNYGQSDPIAALATPLGESAIAIIRTSGTNDDGISAIQLLAQIFSKPEKLKKASGNSIVHGWILDNTSKGLQGSHIKFKKIDEVLISIYRAPNSYTGEDSAEICCHGSIAVIKDLLEVLKKAGFREALPGEFTFRAFMNGKMDLTKAESIMELIASKTGKGREQAVRRLNGDLAKEIMAVKILLVELLTNVQIFLDYSEDEFLYPNDETEGKLPGSKQAEDAVRRLQTLSGLWQLERLYSEGALAVLAGMPNAGKSSLFNYLLREERSIVTNIPGTTRDWIEASISIEGLPLRLADTAGIKETGEQDDSTGDLAEKIGIEKSLALIDKADLLLYVIDGTVGITETDRRFLLNNENISPKKPIIIIYNKSDIIDKTAAPEKPEIQGLEVPGRSLRVSAKTGEGIPPLLQNVGEILIQEAASFIKDGMYDKAIGPGSIRQKELIDSALENMKEVLSLSGMGEPLDIIAPLIKTAINALGEITGEVSNAEILETMFSNFCVGK